MSIIDYFRSRSDLEYLGGVTAEKIEQAEIRLGLVFSSEYRDYLLEFGLVSVDGHELTGIVDSPRLNVVDVTETERKRNKNVPDDLYVIEDLGIDKVFVWQNSKGELFQTIGDSAPKKMEKDLIKYLDD